MKGLDTRPRKKIAEGEIFERRKTGGLKKRVNYLDRGKKRGSYAILKNSLKKGSSKKQGFAGRLKGIR